MCCLDMFQYRFASFLSVSDLHLSISQPQTTCSCWMQFECLYFKRQVILVQIKLLSINKFPKTLVIVMRTTVITRKHYTFKQTEWYLDRITIAHCNFVGYDQPHTANIVSRNNLHLKSTKKLKRVEFGP